MAKCHGTLTFPEDGGLNYLNSPPAGTFYCLLDNGILHLHRGNPYHFVEEGTKENDGEEVAKIKLLDRCWTLAKKGDPVAEPGQEKLARRIELVQEKTTVRKGSLSFTEKIQLKMKRPSKSSGQPLLIGIGEAESEVVAPLVFYAETSDVVDKWITAFNSTFATFVTVPSSPYSSSSSLPQSPSFSTFSLSSRRPSQLSPALTTIPLSDLPTRRPSFLSQASPKSSLSVNLIEPSPPRRKSSTTTGIPPRSHSPSPLSTTLPPSNVPEWISSVKSSTSPSPSPSLKPKRSLSSLTGTSSKLASTSMAVSSSMERSRSDGRSSIDSRTSDKSANGNSGRKLFGFLGVSKKPKKETEALALRTTLSNFSMGSSSLNSPVSPTFSDGRLSAPNHAGIYESFKGNQTNSTTSLADSLQSEARLKNAKLSSPSNINLNSLSLSDLPLSPPLSASTPNNNTTFSTSAREPSASMKSGTSNHSDKLMANSFTSTSSTRPDSRNNNSSSNNNNNNNLYNDTASLERYSNASDSVEGFELISEKLPEKRIGGEEQGAVKRRTSMNSAMTLDVRRRNGMLVGETEGLGLTQERTPGIRKEEETSSNSNSRIHIVKPRDLIAQMAHEAIESNRSPSYSNLRSITPKTSFTQLGNGQGGGAGHQFPKSSSSQTLSSYSYRNGITSSTSTNKLSGGLSPRPVFSSSRQNLNLLSQARLPSTPPSSSSRNYFPSSNSTTSGHTSTKTGIPRSSSSSNSTIGGMWFDSSSTSGTRLDTLPVEIVEEEFQIDKQEKPTKRL